MNPGDLREVVTILIKSNASNDDFGRPSAGDDAQWTEGPTVRARVREEASTTDERGGRNVPNEGVNLLMRDHPKLTRSARLKYNGDTLRIQSISKHGRMNRYKQVECIYSGD